ncbi:hypothetical protein [Nocardia araoensis]|uniref:hypothetical protein n=1 Tax=Nocardia araoensis TaxID=228600 RepID=UPI0012F6DED5|nr:hypothetical protein [Nocardia araoensis]
MPQVRGEPDRDQRVGVRVAGRLGPEIVGDGTWSPIVVAVVRGDQVVESSVSTNVVGQPLRAQRGDAACVLDRSARTGDRRGDGVGIELEIGSTIAYSPEGEIDQYGFRDEVSATDPRPIDSHLDDRTHDRLGIVVSVQQLRRARQNLGQPISPVAIPFEIQRPIGRDRGIVFDLFVRSGSQFDRRRLLQQHADVTGQVADVVTQPVAGLATQCRHHDRRPTAISDTRQQRRRQRMTCGEKAVQVVEPHDNGSVALPHLHTGRNTM